MNKLNDLLAAREAVIKASKAFGTLNLHELYSVRINAPFAILQKGGLAEATNNMRESLGSIWCALDLAIESEREEINDVSE
tara:strand:+ start:2892 stop:3134 length:243 start_codon:yes stop_codon:yes gene_type:complete